MNHKPVGKKAEPTIEELEFIHKCFLKLSDQEILEEMQDTEFPLRSLGFIKRRRREFNAAKKVLQIQLEREIDPIIVKRKDEHFAELASIAKLLLANDLDTIARSSNSSKQKEPRQAEYIVTSRSNFDDDYKLTKEQISVQLQQNLKFVIHEYTRWFLNICFLPHLEAELPEEIELEGFWVGVIEEKPYELINSLRVLAARKIFKGTCPVCKDW